MNTTMAALLIWIVTGLVGTMGGYFWGAKNEKTRCELASQTQKAKNEKDARDREAKWQGEFNEAAKIRKVEVDSLERRLADARKRLRERPERPTGVPETPRADCQGANGPELARDNAEFLIGYAARAEKQDVALTECYSALNSLQKKER